MILFDSKAYKDGFDIKSDDINRFAFYVNDFNSHIQIILETFTLL